MRQRRAKAQTPVRPPPSEDRKSSRRRRRAERIATAAGWAVAAALLAAEALSHRGKDGDLVERLVPVDKSRFGETMRINLNVTFPSLSCDDINVDVMDMAGNLRDGVDKDLLKTRLPSLGLADVNNADLREDKRGESMHVSEAISALKGRRVSATIRDVEFAARCLRCEKSLASLSGDECCLACQEIINVIAHGAGGGKVDALIWKLKFVCRSTEENVVAEMVHKKSFALVGGGGGCNLAGRLDVGALAPGNFHIAMGKGITTPDGKHMHNFIPEEVPKFNTSHIIHHLSFGPTFGYSTHGRWAKSTLDGTKKVITNKKGGTGLFKYFIKIVPTKFQGKEFIDEALDKVALLHSQDRNCSVLETNRYFFTETFEPVGDGTGKTKLMLPGVFFIYDVYPVAIEFTKASSPPATLTWAMALICGVAVFFILSKGALFASTPRKSHRSGLITLPSHHQQQEMKDDEHEKTIFIPVV